MNVYSIRTKLWNDPNRIEQTIVIEARDIMEALKKWEKAALEQDSTVSLESIYGAVVKVAKG